MNRWSMSVGLAILSACSADAKPGAGPVSAAGSGVATAAPDASVNAGGSPAADNPDQRPIMAAAGSSANVDAGEPECGRQMFELERKPADVLLVLDRSASMKDDVNGDDDGNPSKWDLVVPALKEVIGATDAAVAWGLKLFPEGDGAGECNEESYPDSIAVPIKPDNASAVNQAITTTMPEGDGTPTGDAVDEAVNYLKTVPDQNRKYILLATDGEPSCAGKTKGSSDAREVAVAAVQRAASADIHTFVVGIATTKDSASKTLTQLAQAGLEAPASGFYLASTKDELAAAVRLITGVVARCRFPLASAPPNPDHVGVSIGATRVAKDPGQKNGWNYVDGGLSAIELFGAACDTVKNSGGESVSVVFGCKSDKLF